MDSLDFPIEHFSLMKDLAVELKAISAQLLRHVYSYEGFGSWWATIEHNNKILRLLFDGRDGVYCLEPAIDPKEPYQWGETTWQLPGSVHAFPIAEISAAILDATKSQKIDLRSPGIP